MKQLITILTLFVALGVRSQIKVDSVVPNRVCPGDSITVYYTFIGPDTTIQIDMDGPAIDHIWQKVITQSGSIRLKTPTFWDSGESYVSGDWVNSVTVLFCSPVGIDENGIDVKVTYKQVYGNIYLRSDGKKVVFLPEGY